MEADFWGIHGDSLNWGVTDSLYELIFYAYIVDSPKLGSQIGYMNLIFVCIKEQNIFLLMEKSLLNANMWKLWRVQ